MGITTTSLHGFIKPNLDESMSNWPTQNASNCDDIDAFFAHATDTYIVNWEATTTNPTLGTSGFTEGRYWKLWPGLIKVEIRLFTGTSGFSDGSGTYTLNLPFSASSLLTASVSAGSGSCLGKGYLRDSSNIGNSQTAVVRLRTFNTVGVDIEGGHLTSTWQDGSPFGISDFDRFTFSFFYLEAV